MRISAAPLIVLVLLQLLDADMRRQLLMVTGAHSWLPKMTTTARAATLANLRATARQTTPSLVHAEDLAALVLLHLLLVLRQLLRRPHCSRGHLPAAADAVLCVLYALRRATSQSAAA